jgi:hypothetical protein
VLNFRLLLRAQFAVFDKRELAGVNGKGYLRKITIIEAASGKRCDHPVIVTRSREETCLTHVNLQSAVVCIDRSIGARQPQRGCEKKTVTPRVLRSRLLTVTSIGCTSPFSAFAS